MTMTLFVERVFEMFFLMCFSKRFDSIGSLLLTAHKTQNQLGKCGACLPKNHQDEDQFPFTILVLFTYNLLN